MSNKEPRNDEEGCAPERAAPEREAPDVKPREIKWEKPRLFSARNIILYIVIAVLWALFFLFHRGG
ncbi:MAG: hypothetical protein AB1742_05765 [bacterium]